MPDSGASRAQQEHEHIPTKNSEGAALGAQATATPTAAGVPAISTDIAPGLPGASTTTARRAGLLVTLVLGGLTALPPLSMDMYLPALPEVTDALHAPAATVQLTLTACLTGMALGQLVVGPMSDRWGGAPCSSAWSST